MWLLTLFENLHIIKIKTNSFLSEGVISAKIVWQSQHTDGNIWLALNNETHV